MSKTCGKCGHAALDDQALFCNRCGAAVPKERKPVFPVCPGCGAIISDELAQFCDRCGTRITPDRVVCSVCGNPALDSHSLFCTRCGTTFERRPVFHVTTCPSCGAPDPKGQSAFCNRCGASFKRKVLEGDTSPAPVVITPRRSAGPHPGAAVPETEWEPWNDVPYPGSPAPTRPAATESSPPHDHQIDVHQKRYSHLPLVAEEMKKKGDGTLRMQAREHAGGTQKRRPGSQKKGVLGFLKK